MRTEYWDEAAMQSPFRRAVAYYGFVEDRNGNRVKADITIGQGKDAKIVHHRTGRVIRPATAREVDAISGWEPY